MNEITLFLDQDSHKKLYEQIYEYMVNEIRAGKLLKGERLPSTRSLAESLGISRSTVDLAYEQLMAEGYIEAKPCKGYFVCRIEELVQIERGTVNPGTKHRSDQKNSYQIDFSPNAIDMGAFPFDTWRKITRNTLNDDRLELFSLGEPQGDASLRLSISRYLHAARGVNCEPEQIIVGAGNDYLLMLLQYILGDHRHVAMENPSYMRAYWILEALGYRMSTVAMDRQGMSAASLEASGADTAYVMPSHQYPTGIMMPIGRRMELLTWAASGENRYLIEDDYDSEFRYHGKPVPSLQASDRNGRVIYIGTFSKSIAPAIRISFMVLPEHLVARYHESCGFLSSTVSRIDQATLNEFIGDGYFERYLNKIRKRYRMKHDLMVSQLRSWEPEFTVLGENVGLHLLITAHTGISEQEMVTRAAAMGIHVYAFSDTLRRTDDIEECAGQEDNRIIAVPGLCSQNAATVLLGYGGLSMEQISAGLRLLRNCWRIQKEKK